MLLGMWARQQLQIGTDLHHAHVDQRLVQFLLVVRRPPCSHTILPHTQNSYNFYSMPPSPACHYIIFHLKSNHYTTCQENRRKTSIYDGSPWSCTSRGSNSDDHRHGFHCSSYFREHELDYPWTLITAYMEIFTAIKIVTRYIAIHRDDSNSLMFVQ